MTPRLDGDPWHGRVVKLTSGVVLDPLVHKRRRRRERRPSLASVTKQATKAGIAVARYEIKSDGTVVIITDKPGEPEQGKEFDQWLAKKKANNADQS
jgi:hypothetical protein